MGKLYIYSIRFIMIILITFFDGGEMFDTYG